MNEVFRNRPTTLADYVAILQRRKWFLAIPIVIAPIVAFILSHRQQPLYQATAVVFVERTSVVSSLAKVGDPAFGDPNRFLTTQASIARSSELLERVVTVAGISGVTPAMLLSESDITPQSNADLINFIVTNPSPKTATVLANTYASQYTWYKTQLDTASIYAALQILKRRIHWIETHPISSLASSYGTLLEQQSQLETIGKLLASNTKVGQLANGAAQIQPQTRRTVGLATLLGIVLAVGFALLAEALDPRVRSELEVENALGVPVLARIPAPPRRLRKAQVLVTLKEPWGPHAEVFRRLRARIEFAQADAMARTIMVTSAIRREGKSITIANLAVALARGRRRVVVVDLDFRVPSLNRLFHVGSAPGVTDLALERVGLADAIRPITLTPNSAPHLRRRSNDRVASTAQGKTSNGPLDVEDGGLYLLPAGTIPSSAAEFAESDNVSALLERLREQFDFVLVDGPPLLAFGDAMALTAKVDAIVAVVRLGKVTRSSLEKLRRELQSCGAEVIGVVLCGVTGTDEDYFAYSYFEAADRFDEHVT